MITAEKQNLRIRTNCNPFFNSLLILIFISELLICLKPVFLLSQDKLKFDTQKLSDGVIKFYRVKSPEDPPYLKKEFEKIINIIHPFNKELPFGKSVAFLVGVSKYSFLSPQLPFVKNDINDMLKFLLTKGGFDEVYVAREEVVNATLIRRYILHEFEARLNMEDRLLFYYAGHGDDYNGETGYMQFSKAQPDNFYDEQVLRIDEAKYWCKEMKIRHLLFIFDCCASGLVISPRGDNDDKEKRLAATLSDNGSRIIITAGTAGEEVFEVKNSEGKGNGVFTRAFLNVFESYQADKRNAKLITIEEIYARIKSELADIYSQYEKRVTPRIWRLYQNEYRGTFIFVNPHILLEQRTTTAGINDSKLRSDPDILTLNDVRFMVKKLNFFDTDFNRRGTTYVEQYKSITRSGDNVVIDNIYELMWQQGGSSKPMPYGDAQRWIRELNQNHYAGYQNWRLPTLEETKSITGHNKSNNCPYINPIFDEKQKIIWTSDSFKEWKEKSDETKEIYYLLEGTKEIKETKKKKELKDVPGTGWVVDFTSGKCNYQSLNTDDYYVRAVRSVQSSNK